MKVLYIPYEFGHVEKTKENFSIYGQYAVLLTFIAIGENPYAILETGESLLMHVPITFVQII